MCHVQKLFRRESLLVLLKIPTFVNPSFSLVTLFPKENFVKSILRHEDISFVNKKATPILFRIFDKRPFKSEEVLLR